MQTIENKVSQPLNGTKISNLLRGHQTIVALKKQGYEGAQDKQKSKEPKRFGDPVKHSIKEVSEELTGGALLKAALQEYRRRLTEFKERGDRPMESKLGLLDRHLSSRKFGYATGQRSGLESQLEN